jgi:hypothetical protein
MPPSNHRLSAREHLAEAAALHGEGALGAAVRRLRAAATEAVAAVVEAAGANAGGGLLPPVAAEALGCRAIPAADVRAVMHDLHLDCHGQDEGRATEFTARAVGEAIAAVQALVDLSFAAPPSAAALRRPPEPTAELAAAEALEIPQRPETWLRAARRVRRRRRVRSALLSVLMAVLLAGGTTAAWIAGARDGPSSHLDVMARARGLSDLPGATR